MDLTEDGERLPYEALIDAATYDRFPIVVLSGPQSLAEMVRILDILGRLIAPGEVIYLHCWGRVGRTGTVTCRGSAHLHLRPGFRWGRV